VVVGGPPCPCPPWPVLAGGPPLAGTETVVEGAELPGVELGAFPWLLALAAVLAWQNTAILSAPPAAAAKAWNAT
jgi:hypothetical protein